MNFIDFVLLAAIIAAAISVIIHMRRRRKKGGCCGSCDSDGCKGCPYAESCKEKRPD